jgi:hypothetical protein
LGVPVLLLQKGHQPSLLETLLDIIIVIVGRISDALAGLIKVHQRETTEHKNFALHFPWPLETTSSLLGISRVTCSSERFNI